MAATKLTFEWVREWSNPFLCLFPHRFDYIYAPHPNPGDSPAWQTESRHPLSDRLIQQSTYLYGVRFGPETCYGLIDIDIHSIYHPQQDPFAISRIVAALEPIGLVSYIACTSSYSGGLHLYFPFQQAQSSWQLAIALACLLENAGFKLRPGQLEIFPNPKPFSLDGNISLFNAHRLPLQHGSYLLDQTFQPIWSGPQTFVQQWQLTEQRNNVDSKSLKQILKQAKRKHFGISGKAEKFINDLNTEIDIGWTGFGQTNRLLGRITMRTYIFHHMLFGGEPLEGDTLIKEIVKTARSLPGYQEWCRHQHEITQRAEEWARCIENSHYFHFGDQHQKTKLNPQDPDLAEAIDQSPSWNEQRSAATRDRIRKAIGDLLEKNALPIRPTTRFQALLKYGIGGGSLYRHRDLWHPNYLSTGLNQQESDLIEPLTENDLPHPNIKTTQQVDHTEPANNWQSPPSLLPTSDGDNPPSQSFSDRPLSNPPVNTSHSAIHLDGSVADLQAQPDVHFIQQTLFNLNASQDAFQEATRLARHQQQRIKSEASEQRQWARMQRFLESGDPILVAEAMAWAQINPGLLQLNPQQLSLLTHTHPQPPINRSALLRAIEALIQQLGWSNDRVGHELQQRFCQNDLAMLRDGELWHCWEWLNG